ncbi:MAG: hypothetical protein ACC661_06775 [Verrucomicrobiales bacterium]
MNEGFQSWAAILLVLVTLLAFGFRSWRRSQGKGKSSCGHDCGCEKKK